MEQNLVGRYRVIQKVGEGGMAEVFLAHHKDVPTLRVILKKLKDSQQKEEFIKEASNLARLDHNHICTIIDFATIDGVNYIVMKPIDGPSLKDIIKLKRTLPIDQSLKITLAMLGALNYAHGKKIYHRDIKPSNVMLNQQGEAVLIDFGIAKNEDDPEQTQEGIFRGTPHFAAPEQFSPKKGEAFNWGAVDIYAVGLTLYNMLTGVTPFTGTNLGEIALEKVSADPEPPSKHNSLVGPGLDSVVMKSLCRDPKKRYQSAVEMTNALIESANDLPRQELASGDFTVTVHADYFEEVERKKKSEQGSWMGGVVPKVLAGAVLLAVVGYFLIPPMLNKSPEIASLGPHRVLIGEELRFTVFATDADSDSLRLRAFGLPAGATFSDNGDNSGDFSWTPVESQLGKYAPIVSALDDFDSVGVELSIAVLQDSTKDSTGENVSRENVSGEGASIASVSSMKNSATDSPRGEANDNTTSAVGGAPSGKMNGYVRVRVSPSGRLENDGDVIGAEVVDTLIALTPGKHSLRAVNANSKEGSITRLVTVNSNDTSQTTFVFTPVSTKGNVAVSSIPRGGRVFVNDELQVEAAPFTFSLKPGTYSIRVESPSGKQFSDTTVVIKANTENSFVVRFAPE